MEKETIIIQDPGKDTHVTSVPRYKIRLPVRAKTDPGHFPEGFLPDLPAILTDTFAREILELSEKHKDSLHLFIDLPEFIDKEYPWLPYTFALHALILAPQCNVFFRGMDPVEYSDRIDENREMNPLRCIDNFCVYLTTTRNDRPRRIFEEVPTGSFVSFEYRIMPMIRGVSFGFSPAYSYWLIRPYRTGLGRYPAYSTHPYDHLPVRNLTRELMGRYFTKAQWEAKGKTVPGIDKAVFLHDQMRTVVLRPYWSKEAIEGR